MKGVRIALAGVAAVAWAAPALAQGTCDIDLRKPFQLTSAALYIQRHDQQSTADDRAKQLKQAIKLLTDNPSRLKNEVGRNYLLGGAYVRWFLDQGAAPVLRAKRGDLGFDDNPEGEFFLPAALDEAMSAIERDMPACADSTTRYRNAIFSKVLNIAVAHYNTKAYDPAIEYANYALQINPRSSQIGAAYQVLTNAYQAKGDLPGAIGSLEKSIASMGTDATSAPGRATATFNLAIFTRDQALAQHGAARSAGLRRAAELFTASAELQPEGPNAARARAAGARLLQDAGDSVAVAGIYADMMANPSKYTAVQLFEAGVVSANGRKFEDAAKLYEAGLQMNPSYRDALFNVANVYFALKQPERMAPVVAQLRAADPMNPDVLKLVGAVWQERGRQATDPKAKRLAQDSTSAYLEKAAKLPARVFVSQFTVARDGTATIAGSVENLGAAPASFTLIFELVDRTGKGVGSTTAVVEAVAARTTKEFSVQATGASPVAWRYTVR